MAMNSHSAKSCLITLSIVPVRNAEALCQSTMIETIAI